MAKSKSTRATRRKPTPAEAAAARQRLNAMQRQAAERAEVKLEALRHDARKAVREPPIPPNPLIDEINAEGTLGNIATVMCFLEHWEPVDGGGPSEAEEGRWRIQQWLNDTLVYAQAQLEREKKIAAAIEKKIVAGAVTVAPPTEVRP